MPLKFSCRFCKTSITVPDKFAGKKGKCPSCMQTIMVPALPGAVPVASSGGGTAARPAPSNAPRSKALGARAGAPTQGQTAQVRRPSQKLGPAFTAEEEAVPTTGEVKVQFFEAFKPAKPAARPIALGMGGGGGGGKLELRREALKTCQKCGSKNADNERFCKSCSFDMITGS